MIKLLNILEYDDYDEDDTKYDSGPLARLKKYIYASEIGFLTDDDIDYLISEYPVTKKTFIYRGLFFNTKESYENFINSIKNSRIKLDMYSSWTPSKSTALQFSLTRPTNNIMLLGREFFKAEDERKKVKDYTQGYGVILATVVKPNNGIDVRNIPNIAQESEIILPAGTYPVKIIEVFKPHRESIKDIEDINVWIQSQRGLKRSWEKKIDYSMMEYILNNYGDGLNDASKKHLFNMFSGELKNFDWIIDEKNLHDYEYVGMERKKFSFTGKPKKEFYIHGEHLSYNLIYYFPLFSESDQNFIRKFFFKKINDLIKEILLIRKKYEEEYELFFEFGPRILYSILEKSQHSKLARILNSTVGDVYNKLNSYENIQNINNIKDPYEKQRAIEKMADNLKKLFMKVS